MDTDKEIKEKLQKLMEEYGVTSPSELANIEYEKLLKRQKRNNMLCNIQKVLIVVIYLTIAILLSVLSVVFDFPIYATVLIAAFTVVIGVELLKFSQRNK